MFVKIMVFVKILGKGRRRKEISILKSARGKLIALENSQKRTTKNRQRESAFHTKTQVGKGFFFRK